MAARLKLLKKIKICNLLISFKSLEINIFSVPDTMSYTHQFVFDIKEIVSRQ